jgi:hypothetical protein
MPRPSDDFLSDLAEVDGLLDKAGQVLVALRDLAEYEDLHPEAIRRLRTKGTVVGITRESLAEIPTIAAGGQR